MIPGEPNEVAVVPGQCVAWRCTEPVDGYLACAAHSKDFDHKTGRHSYNFLTPEERATLQTLSGKDERQAFIKARYMRARRVIDPSYGRGPERREVSRRREILTRLARYGRVRTAELAADFDVSMATIKRDLIHFDHAGLAVSCYGGAKLPEGVPSDRSPSAA